MKIHVGEEILKKLKESGISKSEFARRINKSRQNVENILKREALDSQLLYCICNVLKHDFFQLYSCTFNFPAPTANTTDYEGQLEQLKKEIRYLEEINLFLRKNKEGGER